MHPPEPTYPCYLPVLGEFSRMTPHEGLESIVAQFRASPESGPAGCAGATRRALPTRVICSDRAPHPGFLKSMEQGEAVGNIASVGATRAGARRLGVGTMGAIAALALAGCGAGQAPPPAGTSSAASASAGGSASASAPALATGLATASAAPSSAARRSAAPSAAPPAAPALKKFTFPDGHLSFEYPAGWSVSVAQGPVLPDGGLDSKIATVRDATGNELATVHSGMYAGGAAGPVSSRTIIEQARVPLPDQRGQAVYAFYADATPDGRTWYSMGIESGPLSASDKSTTGGAVELPNGFLLAHVVFADAPFGSVAAAKAWYASAEGEQLRALFLSLAYA
ncbi:hypothetical protein GCM10007172_38630 [Sinomonas atrocyanea]|nr:hypothetical protein GCM10007172_38630 [Sinomonas atrocyanea]